MEPSSETKHHYPEKVSPSQQVFFSELVNWPKVEELSLSYEPGQEQVEAKEYLLRTLDYIVSDVIQTAFEKKYQQPEQSEPSVQVVDQARSDLLEKITQGYNNPNPALLSQLEAELPGVSQAIEAAINTTLENIAGLQSGAVSLEEIT